MRAGYRAGAGGLTLWCLTACSGQTPYDIYQLNRFDPVTTQAGALRIAVEAPDTVRPEPGGAVIYGRVNGADGAEAWHFEIDLAPITSTAQTADLPKPTSADMKVYGYRIAEDDLPMFNDFRQAAAQARETGDGGSIGVTASLCYIGAQMPEQLPFRSYLKAAELEDYVTLMADKDILAEVSSDDVADLFLPCTN